MSLFVNKFLSMAMHLITIDSNGTKCFSLCLYKIYFDEKLLSANIMLNKYVIMKYFCIYFGIF